MTPKLQKNSFRKKLSLFLRNFLLTLQRVNMIQIPPLSSELKSELTDIFRDDIQKLEKLINRDLSSWLS